MGREARGTGALSDCDSFFQIRYVHFQENRSMSDSDKKIIVHLPEDKKILELIDITAKYVSVDGEAFEQVRARKRCVVCELLAR
jgi:hypothetical protein